MKWKTNSLTKEVRCLVFLKNSPDITEEDKTQNRSCQSVETWRAECGGPAVQDDRIVVDGYGPPGRRASDGVAMAWSQLFTSVPWNTKTAFYSRSCASETRLPPAWKHRHNLPRPRSTRGHKVTPWQKKHLATARKSRSPPLSLSSVWHRWLQLLRGQVELILTYPMCWCEISWHPVCTLQGLQLLVSRDYSVIALVCGRSQDDPVLLDLPCPPRFLECVYAVSLDVSVGGCSHWEMVNWWLQRPPAYVPFPEYICWCPTLVLFQVKTLKILARLSVLQTCP